MSALTIAAQDSATMLWREIKHSIRLLRLLIVSAILVPVVMLLLFDYILGGVVSLVILVYLIVALVRPEKF